MRLRFIILALKDQLPVGRLIRNTLNGNILGLFHKRSHYTVAGNEKVGYRTRETGEKAQKSMMAKKGVYFSLYSCPHCGNYHLGKNSQ